MKISIITPSLNRESLLRCCESVDIQSHPDFQHVVSFDGVTPEPAVLRKLSSPHRRMFVTKKTRAWGNYQRRHAWEYATGDAVIFLDDDNRLAHPDALRDISERLEAAGNPAWTIFPILRHGSVFLHDPPGMCMTDTANLCIRREFAQWPETDAREADGMLAEQLKAKHPYVAFPDCPPIIIMEASSNGV